MSNKGQGLQSVLMQSLRVVEVIETTNPDDLEAGWLGYVTGLWGERRAPKALAHSHCSPARDFAPKPHAHDPVALPCVDSVPRRESRLQPVRVMTTAGVTLHQDRLRL